jgi:outer membrane receptor protein involved in Fe transport
MKSRKPKRRNVTVRMKPVAAAVAAAVGTLPGLLVAQDSREAVPMLEEIVVTATRRAASVQDIPINISAFAGEELEQQRIDNLREFARWVPGLTVVDQGRRAASPMMIRGLNVNSLDSAETPGNNSGDTVATYYGEIPIYVDLKLIDVDRVEVLRGPQGTLFGAGSLGGAVRYIPKKPDTEQFTFDIHGRVYAIEHGDGSNFDGDLVINAPISDKFAFRGLISYQDDGGFIDYTYLVDSPGFTNPEDPALLHTKEDANTFEQTTARLALLWDITDKVETTVSYYVQDEDSGGRQVNHQDSLGTGEYVAAHRVLEPNNRKNQIFNLDIIADFGFAELTSATGYTKYEQSGQRDQTDLLLLFGYPYSDFPEFTAFTAEDEDNKIFTQEFRLVSQGDGPWDWIGGFFYSDADLSLTSTEFNPGISDCNPCLPMGLLPPSITLTDDVEFFQAVQRDLKELAIYGEVGYQFTDQWQATIGARYFDIEDTHNQGFAFPLFDILFDGAPQGQPVSSYFNSTSFTADIDDTIFKFNTSYDFTGDLMAYFTISEGFRNGGSNAIEDCAGAGGANFACGTPNQLSYDPDTVVNYELGLKSSWLDGAMTFNGSLFYIDWKEIQLSDRSFGGAIPITVNGNDAESKGVEASFNWLITDKWQVRAGYSYTNAELSEDAPLVAGGSSKGDRLPGSPEHQGSLLISFLQPLRSNLDLMIDYGLTTQSDMYTTPGVGSGCCRNDGEALPGFTLHNASVSLSGDRWSAMLYANNMFDKYAETGVRPDSTLTGSAGPTQDFTLRRYFKYMVTPRTIGLDFRYKIN